MNRIKDFYNKDIILKLFQKELMPLYPDFREIRTIETKWHKENVWGSTYHVVVEFRTAFIHNDGHEVVLPIFCTAHSSEPRRNVYDSLKFLWDSSFSTGNLSIPRPLFYSDYYHGTFYRGVEGINLYKFIRENKRDEIERIIPQIAAWFAKLHKIPTDNVPNFNVENSRIETVFPGIQHILWRINKDYPHYGHFYEYVYNLLIEKEKTFLGSTDRRWLVHGDAHPENVIKMSDRKIAVIDFTDLSLADFARDLGTFLQQVEFMTMRKLNDAEFTNRMKKLFLDEYLRIAKVKLKKDLEERIETYYHWTAMRTATFFLVKYNIEAERAYPILNKVAAELNIEI